MTPRTAETDLRLKRLFDTVETGVAVLDDPALRERVAGLKALRNQARTDARCAQRVKDDLLRTLAAASGVKSATPGPRSSVPKWRSDGHRPLSLESGVEITEHYTLHSTFSLRGARGQLISIVLSN